jgi:hypothetical protein
MPKGKATVVPIPNNAKFEVLSGEGFIKIREAAKLSGIHPVVLEMAQHLLKNPSTTGASFALATPDLQKRGADIAAMFKSGLKKCAKALDPTHICGVKVHHDDDRVVCWYVASHARGPRSQA